MKTARLVILTVLVLGLTTIVYVYRSPTLEDNTAPVAATTKNDATRSPASRRNFAVVPRHPAGKGLLSGLGFPVVGIGRSQLRDTWGQPREGGARAHEAIDIPAPGGTPVIAALSGRIEKLFNSARGGIVAYVRSDDGQWITYYAHLAGYAEGVHEGLHVARGQAIGFVGDTGDAGAGNTHLHFSLVRMSPSDRWWQGTPVNPYPLLAGKTSAP